MAIREFVSGLMRSFGENFYKNIMHSFPRVSMNQPFNLSTTLISWRYDAEEFDAWKEGKTGFPLIDAAMHQLKYEGWMHNRLRMVVAMFLQRIYSTIGVSAKLFLCKT